MIWFVSKFALICWCHVCFCRFCSFNFKIFKGEEFQDGAMRNAWTCEQWNGASVKMCYRVLFCCSNFHSGGPLSQRMTIPIRPSPILRSAEILCTSQWPPNFRLVDFSRRTCSISMFTNTLICLQKYFPYILGALCLLNFFFLHLKSILSFF